MKLIFKASTLQPLLEVTAKAKTFRIPYEGDKTGNKPTLWLVKDAGIYLMPSTKENLTFPLDKKFIAYANGNGPTTFKGGDDYVETVPFDEDLQKFVRDGYDMFINITARNMSIGFIKPQ